MGKITHVENPVVSSCSEDGVRVGVGRGGGVAFDSQHLNLED